LNFEFFIYYLIAGYYIRLLIIIIYSLKIHTPRFSFTIPPVLTKIIFYSFLIFLSGAASSIILDIDKSMIATLITADDVAYYSVALFIAAVVEAPGRAMFQITSPLVSDAINSNNNIYLKNLLVKSSKNLLIVSGGLFLLINLNLIDFYDFVKQPKYAVAIGVVGIVSSGKLYSMSIGCLNNIISNSKYYPFVFWFSILSAIIAVILNFILIPKFGIIGAAYATLFVIIFINTLKLILVAVNFNIYPYSSETIKIAFAIAIAYLFANYIKLDFNSFINILIRSSLIVLIYSILCYFLGLTREITNQIKKFLKP
jgi:O-antigen/teichoic acid export membrane protein